MFSKIRTGTTLRSSFTGVVEVYTLLLVEYIHIFQNHMVKCIASCANVFLQQ